MNWTGLDWANMWVGVAGDRCKTVMVEVTELDKYQGYT